MDDRRTQLDRVQAAIAEIEAGAQEYTIEDRTFRRGDLAVLYKRERQLLCDIASENIGATRAYVGWNGR